MPVDLSGSAIALLNSFGNRVSATVQYLASSLDRSFARMELWMVLLVSFAGLPLVYLLAVDIVDDHDSGRYCKEVSKTEVSVAVNPYESCPLWLSQKSVFWYSCFVFVLNYNQQFYRTCFVGRGRSQSQSQFLLTTTGAFEML